MPFSARRVHLTRFSALVATGCRICAGTLVGLKPYAERAAPSQLAFQRSQYQWRSLRQWQRSGERRWRPPESPGRREWCRSAQPAEWRRPVRRWRQVVVGPLRRRRAQAGQRARWRRCTWRRQQVRYQPAFGRRRSDRARWRPTPTRSRRACRQTRALEPCRVRQPSRVLEPFGVAVAASWRRPSPRSPARCAARRRAGSTARPTTGLGRRARCSRSARGRPFGSRSARGRPFGSRSARAGCPSSRRTSDDRCRSARHSGEGQAWPEGGT